MWSLTLVVSLKMGSGKDLKMNKILVVSFLLFLFLLIVFINYHARDDRDGDNFESERKHEKDYLERYLDIYCWERKD